MSHSNVVVSADLEPSTSPLFALDWSGGCLLFLAVAANGWAGLDLGLGTEPEAAAVDLNAISPCWTLLLLTITSLFFTSLCAAANHLSRLQSDRSLIIT
ncbi:hypothetical protein HZ326_20542 [Fusarium oxysporum f. sp. albedinis]|nr:hypothetical protein HZ326_20542 [Fusarium oxysporum f. sp. albedinis]